MIDAGELILTEIKQELKKSNIYASHGYGNGSRSDDLHVNINTNKWKMGRMGQDPYDAEKCIIGYNYDSTNIEVNVIPAEIAIDFNGIKPQRIPFRRAIYCFDINREGAIDDAVGIVRYIYNTRKEIMSQNMTKGILICVSMVMLYIMLFISAH